MTLSSLIRIIVMPPTNLLLLMALGLLLQRRWPRAGRTLSWSAIAPLENLTTPLADANTANAQAIVVLSAGMVDAAPEYGGMDAPDPVTLVRLQYGAYLQHRTGLPLLVSGGSAPSTQSSGSLGAMMARTLREDFRTPVTWIEDQSETTGQNAVYSARMLKAAGVKRVLLVTHAMHMPRSREAFAREGMDVVEAPTLFYSRARWSPTMLFPGASGLYRSYYACHEWVGLIWYRLQAQR